jgi:serine/threonine protein kinase
MALASGTRLGPYQIESTLGGGGMGDVYRARDTRLQRDVAIKVLAGHVAHRADLRERFEREARTIAALNHPHICVVYDVGHQDGIDFLVMEYLEGETLAQRLKRGPLPLADVLRLGAEIGDALDKAHRKGVTHRDLKPANILLTKTGAKLLDFGLAKLRPAASSPEDQPTQGDPITAEGTILGTMHYMSPEQLEGKEADARSDIFSFGAVLYEMATGKRAFDGKSQASVIAAIMASEPSAMSAIQPMTPAPLDRLVRKCLRKDPDERWQSAHDITDELRWIGESSTATSVPSISSPPASHWRRRWGASRIGAMAAAVIVLAVVAVVIAWPRLTSRSAPASPTTPVRFTVGAPEGGRFPPPNTAFGFMNLSPDGATVTFAGSSQSGRTLLWVRRLDAASATPLPGTDGAGAPFWSPDSRFIGFFAEGKLKKVPATGGPAQTVVDSAQGSASWSAGGVILFARGFGVGPLYRVSDAGGTAAAATELNEADSETAHYSPAFLPDGDHYLFFIRNATADRSGVYLGSLSSKERIRVSNDFSAMMYAEPGYVVFHRDGTVMAQPFDAARRVTTAEAIPIAEGVQFNGTAGLASFAVSQNGVMAYRSAVGAAPRTLVWVSRNGTEQPLAASPLGYQQPRLSPDGRRIVVQIEERDNQVWIYDISRETLTRLTFQASDNQLPIWSPDGRRVAYYSNQAGPLNLFWQPADGSGASERLTKSDRPHAAMSWSPDGRIAFTEAVGPDRNIWVLNTADRTTSPFIATAFTEGGAQFSPDVQWVAYVSNESGRPEVYVQPYPGPGGKWQVSTEGGSEPMWNRNGRELFYRNGNKMMAVPVSTAGGFSSGRPQMLFERRYVSTQLPQTGPYYDPSADGQRFLMVKEPEQDAGPPINIILNWPALLNSRLRNE